MQLQRKISPLKKLPAVAQAPIQTVVLYVLFLSQHACALAGSNCPKASTPGHACRAPGNVQDVFKGLSNETRVWTFINDASHQVA